jgi:hypothetical protein
MGGSGSGNWYHWDKKNTVEDGLSLSVYEFFKNGWAKHWNGNVTWFRNEQQTASISYAFSQRGNGFRLTLNYTSNGEAVSIPLDLEEVPTPFGGKKYYFSCPLLLPNGLPCERRCQKLHLPPGGKYFGCRECHKLTYTSCQESHKFDGLFGSIGREVGIDPEDVKFFLSMNKKKKKRRRSRAYS